ncbi:hypothetical protein FNF29_05650 [Cafeteria roenbergensis]|uniref:RBR-type E3 ubiquitin transferase n=1 Tax=Cafeteria roenbergensis TaxID=33653 RepID=A0A5A8CBE0_CAFRO|nr:hypothetical protein FNF29_05650 [Cafeteria roenbergensis]|eukprot:KAA0149824.1 hypothetical protein FNF29_05650 [Cafeteria roenbergensis]
MAATLSDPVAALDDDLGSLGSMQFEEDEWGEANDGASADHDLAAPRAIGPSPSAPGVPTLAAAASYTIDDDDAVGSKLDELAKEVEDATLLPAEDCRLLLPSFGYDAEALARELAVDEAGCLKRGGLTLEDDEYSRQHGSGLRRPSPPDGAADTDEFDCPACFDCVPYKEADALPCGDWLCAACWRSHLAATLALGPGEVVNARCPACPERIRWRMWSTYCTAEQAAMVSERATQHLQDTWQSVRSCPAPGCSRTATYHKQTVREIACECGHHWCFSCAREWHGPSTCAESGKWALHADEDAVDMQWILANAKPCPSCKRPIEKNDGCLHMTCGKGSGAGCGHEFCWICMGPWAPHGTEWYNCKMTKPPSVEEEERKALETKAKLARLIPYVSKYRFHAHAQKLTLRDDRPAVASAVATLLACGTALPGEAAMARAAVRTLISSHRALKACYVWCFNHDSQPAFERFVPEVLFRRRELERLVDLLHKAVEAPALAAATAAAELPGRGEAEWTAYLRGVEPAAHATLSMLHVFRDLMAELLKQYPLVIAAAAALEDAGEGKEADS